ncbi:MAG: hypothetical protein OHK93_000643 [Ramalina farinacea]|uniref:Uncharacterized protein n=1 Tax=Ramalina farinacea TaxID=258253 RepID=A0AA43TSS1_9LECA|nr:hypothetical protein [Ramalina farinacea]
MAPPPFTPSPHRFAPPKSRPSQKAPSSSLRFSSTQPSPSQQQFAPTPKFQFSTPRPSANDTRPPQSTPQHSSPLTRRPAARRKDDIEEFPSSSDRDTDDDDDDAAGLTADLPTPEQLFAAEAPQPRGIKRPHPTSSRGAEDAIVISSSSSPSEDEVTPPTTPPCAAHSSSPHKHSSRTPFILPPLRSPTPPPPSTPSAFFSPTGKRGQRYIPGGMASTVREWVVEASMMRGSKVGGWDYKVRVPGKVGFGGDGRVVVVRDEGERAGWILIAGGEEGGGRIAGGVKGVERLVGVREPVWDVELWTGEVWRVGVEWDVIGEG